MIATAQTAMYQTADLPAHRPQNIEHPKRRALALAAGSAISDERRGQCHLLDDGFTERAVEQENISHSKVDQYDQDDLLVLHVDTAIDCQ